MTRWHTSHKKMISAVVVNWNSGAFLEKCIASLQSYAAGCEVVVVDNASEDRSADFLVPGPGIVLVANPSNMGFAAANNTGWRRARGDLVLFLNPDVECQEGAADSLREVLDRTPSVWAAAGSLLQAPGESAPQMSIRRLPSISSVAAEMLLLDEIWPRNPWTVRYRMTGEDLRADRAVEQPAAACLMIRRTALEAIGGFDEGFRPAWFEDVDLCKRLRDAGGTILFHPSARFVHHGGYSLERLPYAEFLEYYHLNQIRYFLKHHGARDARRVRGLVVAGMRLRAAVSIFHPLVRGSSRTQSFRIFRQAARRFSDSSRDRA